MSLAVRYAVAVQYAVNGEKTIWAYRGCSNGMTEALEHDINCKKAVSTSTSYQWSQLLWQETGERIVPMLFAGISCIRQADEPPASCIGVAERRRPSERDGLADTRVDRPTSMGQLASDRPHASKSRTA